MSDGSKTPSTCCLKETHVKSEDTCRQKGNGCKKIYYTNSNQKKAGVAISILERGESQLQGKERYQGKQYIIQCQRSKFAKKTQQSTMHMSLTEIQNMYVCECAIKESL